MKRVIITRRVAGITKMQVCVHRDTTDQEILTACNIENPSGTLHGWSHVAREDTVQCADYPDRVHLIVLC